jgi:hypothetical protein
MSAQTYIVKPVLWVISLPWRLVKYVKDYRFLRSLRFQRRYSLGRARYNTDYLRRAMKRQSSMIASDGFIRTEYLPGATTQVRYGSTANRYPSATPDQQTSLDSCQVAGSSR